MPSETFFNLPTDKRERFVQVAAAEFAAHPYDSASITRIVRELGIAKGSVYQYFADKLDLFLFLLDEAGRRKLAAIGPLSLDGLDVFERLARMYAAGLALYRDEPVWAALSLRLTEPSREPRLEAMRAELASRSRDGMRTLLAEARDAGQLRHDVDVDVAAALVHAMLAEGLLAAWRQREDAALEPIVDQALSLLRHGLSASYPQPELPSGMSQTRT
ncbi:MAG: TetR/AcrR family transcriptional regulator [Deltaproteobacteria bacterium]|nr:MAG: TetR/AcrR family transcriptional regulator [Deltaproteobacteria bacterium]